MAPRRSDGGKNAKYSGNARVSGTGNRQPTLSVAGPVERSLGRGTLFLRGSSHVAPSHVDWCYRWAYRRSSASSATNKKP